MKQLIEKIEKLGLRSIGFGSLTKAIDTTTAQGVLVFHMFSALAEFEHALQHIWNSGFRPKIGDF